MGVVARGKVDFEDHKPYTEPEYEGILSPDCLSFLTLRSFIIAIFSFETVDMEFH